MLASINEKSFTQDVFNSSTPVLVHFWAPWCGLCRMINPLLLQFQAEWGDRIKVVGINADNSLKLANQYRLSTLPTLILFDGDRIVQRLEGFHGRDALRIALEESIAPYSRTKSIETSPAIIR
ncbi:MAG: thioredoxin domain-containing protein [Geitlerinemataceae cyanobacterium]